MFKKRSSSRNKPQSANHDATSEQRLIELENDVANVIAGSDAQQNGFFCTDEPFITSFDDKEILRYIRIRFPDFGENPGSAQFKRLIFDFLEDGAFIQDMMRRFDLKPYDFFKFLFRLEPSVFKGMFMKRVKEIAARQPYCR